MLNEDCALHFTLRAQSTELRAHVSSEALAKEESSGQEGYSFLPIIIVKIISGYSINYLTLYVSITNIVL